MSNKKIQNIGFMGLGKLGLPCGLAVEHFGHFKVLGYDPGPNVAEILRTRELPYREEGAQELLEATAITLVSTAELVEQSDLIFIPIQTPHDPKYEGITRLPDERIGFDYSFLRDGVYQLSYECARQQKSVILVIISTVLPGTVDKVLRPLLNEYTQLVYNPFFIAMGTAISNFIHPEFILLGVDDPDTADEVEAFYRTFIDAPVERMSIASAEMTKVAYNTAITSKICIANTLMGICYRIPEADIDDVTRAMQHATKRVVSPAYMTAGLGDGGGCHCRDNIALSALSRELKLPFDWFEGLMKCREANHEWLADLMVSYPLPKVILGYTFKSETNLTVGSPALLVKSLLEEKGAIAHLYDPDVDSKNTLPSGPAIYLIGCRKEEFVGWDFPKGSIVLDPHRIIPDREGVQVIRIGEGQSRKSPEKT